MMSPRDRYYQDPNFHQLVDMLWHEIERANFTPTELREAVILAAILYGERRPIQMPIWLENGLTDWISGEIEKKTGRTP